MSDCVTREHPTVIVGEQKEAGRSTGTYARWTNLVRATQRSQKGGQPLRNVVNFYV